MSLLAFLAAVAGAFYAGYETGRRRQAERDMKAIDRLLTPPTVRSRS